MANLIFLLSDLISFKQLINIFFIIVPLIIIAFCIVMLIRYFKKDGIFIIFVVRILICLFIMMLPIIYNTSSLLFHYEKLVDKQDKNEHKKGDNLAFDYEKNKRDSIFFIGDSRTVGMYNAIHGGTGNIISINTDEEIWFAKVSASYNWFLNDALKQIDSYINNDNYTFLILMGANDLYNANLAKNYINIIGEYAKNYSNSRFIFVSVNPINDELSINHGYSVVNQNVVDFNNKLNETINDLNLSNLLYCDTYSYIINDYETSDGLHYNASTYKKIYNLINECL